MQIENIISSLLTKNNKVIIPGLGIIENVEGKGDEKIFISNSVVADSSLAADYSNHTGLSVKDSESIVNEMINDLKKRLSDNSIIEIPSIGTLQMVDNKIVLDPFKTNLFPSDFLTYVTIEEDEKEITPIIEEEKVENTASKEIENTKFDTEKTTQTTSSTLEPKVEKIHEIAKEEFTVVNNTDQMISSKDLSFNNSDDKAEGNKVFTLGWKKIAFIILLLFCLGFFVPYIVATYSGKTFLNLPPLWNNTTKVEETKKIIKDTSIVSAEEASKNPISNNLEDSTSLKEVAEVAKVAPVSSSKVAESVPAKTAEVASSKSTPVSVKTTEITPKTVKKVEAPKIEPKKEVKPTAEVKKVKEVVKKEEKKSTIRVPKKSETSMPSSPQVVSKPRVVIPKNIPTAPYKKGIYYLSFGTFTNPNNALKLRKDLSNYGIVTDIIQREGQYVVSIAYKDKSNADNASAQFPNTVVIE